MADPVGALINIGLQIILRLAIAALTPKQHTEGPRLEDRSLTTSTYGEDIPIGFGTVLFTGNVIWGQDIREEAVTTDIGKGNPFSIGTQTIYYYYATLAIGICERQMEGLVRIYADGKLIYKRDGHTVTERMEGLDFRFYRGTESQEPDPLIAADYEDEEVPGYRGLCYIVFNDMPLENFGNRIPQFQFVVTAAPDETIYRSATLNVSPSGDLLLNTDEQAVFDRGRNVVYAGTFTDSIPTGFAPHFLVTLDATTGELLDTLRLSEIDRDPIVLGTNVQGNTINLIQPPMPDDEPRWIAGGDTPYLVLVEDSNAYATHAFLRKDTMEVLSTTYSDGGVAENGVVWDAGTQIRLYLCSSGGAQIVEVRQGFLRKYYFVGFSAGGLNLQIWSPDADDPYGGAARGRGYINILPLPECWPLIRSDHIQLAPNDSYGVMGTTIGYKGNGFTDVYAIHKLQANAYSRFCIMRHRITYAGGSVGTILTADNLGRSVNSGGSSPVTDYNSGAFPDMTLLGRSNPLRYDAGSDILVVQGDADNGDTVLQGYYLDSANSNGEMTLRWTIIGYGMSGQVQDADSTNSPDGTVLLARIGESSALANFYILDIATGEITTIDLTQGIWEDLNGDTVNSLGSGSPIWDGPNMRFMSLHRIFNVSWMYLEALRGRGRETLKDVVEDICLRSKLTAGDIDATELATVWVRGYPVQQSMSYRAALEPLAAAYNFYGVEQDGQIVFKFKTGAITEVIPEDDLVFQGEDLPVIEEGRAQDADLPRALYLTYQSAEDDWLDERSTQVVRRITLPNPAMQAFGELRMEVPLTLTDAEAQEIAQRLMYEAWVGQETFKFQLPHRYLHLLPNDVVQITAEDRTEAIRLEKVSVAATLEVEVEGKVTESEIYGLNVMPTSVIGSPRYGRRGRVIAQTVPRAVGFVLDVPYLQDGSINDMQGLYLFVAGRPSGYGGDFNGAAVATSVNEAPFAFRTSVTTEMAWGRLITTMPDIPGADWNSVQEASVDINIFAGDSYFSSVTQDDMIQNDANTAILYEPGSGKVEVIGFRDVETITEGEWVYTRLTGFMRGKRGTDTMASGYSGATYIIIANSDWISGFFENIGLLEATSYYKAVPLGSNPDNIAETSMTYEHRSLKPWAPCHPQIDAGNPSVGAWTLTWERRTRYNGAWMNNFGNVALGEAAEGYEVDILSGPGGTVVRTLTSVTTSVIYTEAMAIVDYGSGFPDTLYCRIYQISGTIGRGFANEYALALE